MNQQHERTMNMAATKKTTVQDELDAIEADLASVKQAELELRSENEAALGRVRQLTERLSEVALAGEGRDDVEVELAAAEAEANSAKWRARRSGLERRERQLKARQHEVTRDGLAELSAELVEQADRLAAEVAEWAGRGEQLRDAWVAQVRAWEKLTVDLGGFRVVGRMDVPPFPAELPDPEVRPVPTRVDFLLAGARPPEAEDTPVAA